MLLAIFAVVGRNKLSLGLCWHVCGEGCIEGRQEGLEPVESAGRLGAIAASSPMLGESGTPADSLLPIWSHSRLGTAGAE